MELFWSLLGFALVIAIIVTIHEWGHYQIARLFNIKILRFSVGFGKPVYSCQGKETEFVIARYPLGGFVKFADETEGKVDPIDAPRAFNRQGVLPRMAVALAGPMVNLIFAWLAFSAIFMIGVTGLKPFVEPNFVTTTHSQDLRPVNWHVTSINGQPVSDWKAINQEINNALIFDRPGIEIVFTEIHTQKQSSVTKPTSILDVSDSKELRLQKLGLVKTNPDVPVVVAQVLKSSPAEKAGLQKGDKIIAVDNRRIKNSQELMDYVKQNPDKKIEIQYQRQGELILTHTTLTSHKVSGELQGQIGMSAQIDNDYFKPYQTTIQYGFFESFIKGYDRSIELVVMSYDILKRMVLGQISFENLSGPITIAQFSGEAIQSGLINFLSLLGILSLSIGILNLLPIPALDGGHLLFYTIELIKGTPLSKQSMKIAHVLGVTIILALTLIAVFNDINRLINN